MLSRLTPLHFLESKEVPDQVLTRLVKMAAKIDIPLTGQVVQSQHGPPNFEVRHAWYGDDLSLAEQRLVDTMVKTIGLTLDSQVLPTQIKLRYIAVPRPS